MARKTKNGTLPAGFVEVGGQTISLGIGESLIGVYEGARIIVQGKGKGKKKRESVIYSFNDGDGVVTEMWGSAALDRQMAKVQTGDEVYIVRIKDAPKKNGQAFGTKLFKVGVKRATKSRAKRGKRDLLPARA
jgi:hypothetical protein